MKKADLLFDERELHLIFPTVQIRKTPEEDKQRLGQGVELCKEIFRRLGAKEDSIFLGTINAGHPGGMLPLTEREAQSFHHDRLPQNLYVADATLIPQSLGNPPILTIIAIAKRISKMCAQEMYAEG